MTVLRPEFFEEMQTMQIITNTNMNSIQGEYRNTQGNFDGLKEKLDRTELSLGNYMATFENKTNTLKCYDPV